MRIKDEHENAMLDYTGWREGWLFSVGKVTPEWNAVRAKRTAEDIRRELSDTTGLINVIPVWPYTIVLYGTHEQAKHGRELMKNQGRECGEVYRVKISRDGQEYKLVK